MTHLQLAAFVNHRYELFFIGTTHFLDLTSTFVELKRWHCSNTALRCNIGKIIHIDFDKHNVGILLAKALKYWSDCTARSTPKGKEINLGLIILLIKVSKEQKETLRTEDQRILIEIYSPRCRKINNN